MLSIFLALCPNFLCVYVVIQAQKRSFFLAESSRHKSIVRTIGQKESCRGGRLVTAPWCPFMLQRKSQTTNQPTNNNKKHETSKQQQQPNQRPHILPETIVHLGARRRFVVVVLVILSKQTPRGFLLSESTRRTKRNHQRMVDGET